MIILRLPYPGKAIWPNARPHPMARAHAKIAQKQAVAAEVKRVGKPARPFLAVSVLLIYTAKYEHHIPDPDNCLAAAKAAIDGLVLEGVLQDDCAVVYEPPIVEVINEPRRLTMHITELRFIPGQGGRLPRRRPTAPREGGPQAAGRGADVDDPQGPEDHAG